MDGLLEIVFENVSRQHLVDIIISIIGREDNLIEARQDGSPVNFDDIFDASYWGRIATASEEISCTFNSRYLNILNKNIRDITTRVVHYGSLNDVSVLFSSHDCKYAGFFAAEDFFQWASEISKKYEVDNFFGGLDPASDENTQLFSRDGVGPIDKL